MKRKSIFFILTIVFCFAFIACGNDEAVDEGFYSGFEGQSVKNNSVTLLEARAGDIVCFGHYEQDNDESNGKEEILWRVLDTSEFYGSKHIVLLSDSILDVNRRGSLWGLLNDVFLQDAFSEQEQSQIDNLVWGKVEALKRWEVERYFSSPEDYRSNPTEYAQARAEAWGVETSWSWWLWDYEESLGRDAYAIDSTGNVVCKDRESDFEGVRPKITVKIPKGDN